MVWIDTGTTARCKGFWSNEFEADLVTQVVRAMRPEPGRRGSPSLAVLTPYRDQVELLQGKLIEHRERVYHRRRLPGSGGGRGRREPGPGPGQAGGHDARRTVGHVADPGRTNVLLSRARELLVVVGRLDVFS